MQSLRLLIENASELLAAIHRCMEEKIEISLPVVYTPFADAALPERLVPISPLLDNHVRVRVFLNRKTFVVRKSNGGPK